MHLPGWFTSYILGWVCGWIAASVFVLYLARKRKR